MCCFLNQETAEARHVDEMKKIPCSCEDCRRPPELQKVGGDHLLLGTNWTNQFRVVKILGTDPTWAMAQTLAILVYMRDYATRLYRDGFILVLDPT